MLRNALAVGTLACAALAPNGVRAAEDLQPPAIDSKPEQLDEELLKEVKVTPDIHLPRTCPPTLHWGATAGYRFWSLSGVPSRVAPYEDPGSGVAGSVFVDRLGKELKFTLDADLVSEHDYLAELDIDYGAQYRVHVATSAFRHNLDYLHASTDDFSLVTSFGSRSYRFNYEMPTASYGLDTIINTAHFRYRLSNYPLHLNLSVWQFLQEGKRQQRFADLAGAVSGNRILSEARPVDSVVTETAASVDGHFGLLDTIYSLTWRELNDRTAVPTHNYLPRTGLDGGTREHNAVPESRYLGQSLSIHTSMTGRIVGAASYALAVRDNRGSLADTSMSERPSDTVQNGAADLNLTFSPQLSAVLRYRLAVIDKDGPSSVTSNYLGTMDVRPGIDLRKNQLTAAILYRPLPSMTVKGEYTGEFLRRSGIQAWPDLDDRVESHRGSLSVQARPMKGMRLRASYTHTATTSSSYGTSYDQRHDTQLLASYLGTKTIPWGGTLSGRFVEELNGHLANRYWGGTLPRDRSLANGTALAWFSPFSNLTISGFCGYHRNDIDQTILFEMANAASATESSYRGEVQLLGLTISHQPLDRLTLTAGYQNILSRGVFSPDSRTISAVSDTYGIADISRVDIREDAVSLRADYRFDRNISCAVDYAYRDYRSRTASQLDGTMQRIMATLSARW
jgi:hypothetical protein